MNGIVTQNNIQIFKKRIYENYLRYNLADRNEHKNATIHFFLLVILSEHIAEF